MASREPAAVDRIPAKRNLPKSASGKSKPKPTKGYAPILMRPNGQNPIEGAPPREDSQAPAALTWINTSNPSEKKKYDHQIRSHAVLFAHTQRQQRRKTQQKQQELETSPPLIRQHSIWNQNPFIRLPLDINNELKQFLHLLSLDDRPVVAYYRSTYFEDVNLTSSEAAFYSNLSIIPSMICMQPSTPPGLKPYYERQDLLYTSRAMKYIRGHLSDRTEVRTNEGLVSAVASLQVKSQIRRDPISAALHFNALENIIRVRGGLQGVEEWTRMLVVFIDIVTCCNTDSPPRLTQPSDFLPTIAAIKSFLSNPPCITSSSEKIINTTSPLPPTIFDITTTLHERYPSLHKITLMFNEIAINSTLEAQAQITKAQSSYTSRAILQYHLISLLSLQKEITDGTTAMGEVLRLALLVFVVSKGGELSDAGFINSRAQMRKLRGVWETNGHGYGVSWAGLEGLRAWAVAVALVEAKGEEDIGWWSGVWKGVLRGLVERGPKPEEFYLALDEVPMMPKAEGEGGKVKKRSAEKGLRVRVPRQVEEIMWEKSKHGKRYQEMFGGGVN